MPVRGVASVRAGVTLITTAQAIMHAPHPGQRSRSIVTPYRAGLVAFLDNVALIAYALRMLAGETACPTISITSGITAGSQITCTVNAPAGLFTMARQPSARP